MFTRSALSETICLSFYSRHQPTSLHLTRSTPFSALSLASQALRYVRRSRLGVWYSNERSVFPGRTPVNFRTLQETQSACSAKTTEASGHVRFLHNEGGRPVDCDISHKNLSKRSLDSVSGSGQLQQSVDFL